jgi:two-component sensor histidine kinase
MRLILRRAHSRRTGGSLKDKLQRSREAKAETQRTRNLFEESVKIRAAEISDAMERGISRSLAEKEALLKELHHRVKNNLQVICSLLRLQSGYVPEGPARTMFRNSEERVKCIALVYERLYRSESLTSLGFNGYVAELLRQLLRTYGVDPSNAEISIQLEPVEIPVEKAVPAGLILNELITNALKHGHSPDGKIALRISLRTNNAQVELEVADRGCGLSKDIDPLSPSSLGLRVVQTLCKQLNATLQVDRDSGTTFSLKFLRDKPEATLEHTQLRSSAVA